MLKLLVALVGLTLAQDQSQSIELDHEQITEPCLKMAAGERLEFSFSASAPVGFNIHYHELDDSVHFPVHSDAIASRAGIYIAPLSRTYCLMWTNNHEQTPVRLEYRYQYYSLDEQ